MVPVLTATMTGKIQTMAVVGAGTMGHGIAQVAATAGIRTALFDSDPKALEAGANHVQTVLDRLVSKGSLTVEQAKAAAGELRAASSLDDAVSGVDLVVEAVPEKIGLKLELFREIDGCAPPDAVLATNTSSLSVTEIGGATQRPDRVVGLHFFNPVHRMSLVEIVRGLSTSDETIGRAHALVAALGKQAITVKDWPGFATSRLGLALGAEAIRMVEQGITSVEDIDRAMELGYGHPMGPLKLTDLVGLDVRLAILEHLHRELGESFRPPALLRQMVRAGKLGRKSGEGFYRYPSS